MKSSTQANTKHDSRSTCGKIKQRTDHWPIKFRVIIFTFFIHVKLCWSAYWYRVKLWVIQSKSFEQVFDIYCLIYEGAFSCLLLLALNWSLFWNDKNFKCVFSSMFFKLNFLLIYRYFSNKKITFKDYLFELKYKSIWFSKKIHFPWTLYNWIWERNFSLCSTWNKSPNWYLKENWFYLDLIFKRKFSLHFTWWELLFLKWKMC